MAAGMSSPHSYSSQPLSPIHTMADYYTFRPYPITVTATGVKLWPSCATRPPPELKAVGSLQSVLDKMKREGLFVSNQALADYRSTDSVDSQPTASLPALRVTTPPLPAQRRAPSKSRRAPSSAVVATRRQLTSPSSHTDENSGPLSPSTPSTPLRAKTYTASGKPKGRPKGSGDKRLRRSKHRITMQLEDGTVENIHKDGEVQFLKDHPGSKKLSEEDAAKVCASIGHKASKASGRNKIRPTSAAASVAAAAVYADVRGRQAQEASMKQRMRKHKKNADDDEDSSAYASSSEEDEDQPILYSDDESNDSKAGTPAPMKMSGSRSMSVATPSASPTSISSTASSQSHRSWSSEISPSYSIGFQHLNLHTPTLTTMNSPSSSSSSSSSLSMSTVVRASPFLPVPALPTASILPVTHTTVASAAAAVSALAPSLNPMNTMNSLNSINVLQDTANSAQFDWIDDAFSSTLNNPTALLPHDDGLSSFDDSPFQ